MRERLIELLDMNCGYVNEMKADELADYLLQNGVVVLPDKVFQTDGIRVYESKVTKVVYRTENFDFDEDAIGTLIFLTKEEAEKHLKGSEVVCG